jgi:nucleotide-binding universal stress UspA family protein
VMPGPIVCGIDSSPGAGGAARVAAALARELDCRLVLAHVAGESSTFPHGERPLWKRPRRQAAARERLEQMASMLADLEPSVAVSFGEPAQRLVTVCDERDAELLVVPPRLRRGLDRFRPSVFARLMTRTPCPLLLVPEGAARRFFAADLTGTPTVVCGFDGTDDARRAAEVAKRLATALRLDVVQVLAGPDTGADTTAAARSGLGSFDRDEPADTLARRASREGAKVLVVGSRGRGPLRAALLGSVSRVLATRAPLPVVAVPPTARLPRMGQVATAQGRAS